MEHEHWLKSDAVLKSWKEGFRNTTTPTGAAFISEAVRTLRKNEKSLWAEYREPYSGIRLIAFELNPTVLPPRVMCRVWFYGDQTDLQNKFSATKLPALLSQTVNAPIAAFPRGSWKSELVRLKVEVVGVQYDVRLPEVFALPLPGSEDAAISRIRAVMGELATEFLCWVDATYALSAIAKTGYLESLIPPSVDENAPLGEPETEGGWQEVTVSVYERSSANRKACLEHYGPSCQACGMTFKNVYGELGSDFIHVHHEIPLHSMAAAQVVDPVKDMKPLCPNCHSMVHRSNPPMAVRKLRQLLGGGS